MTIKILDPAPWTRITNVKQTGSAPSGSICACGTATQERGTLTAVWAIVYPLGTAYPPTHDPNAQQGSVNGTTGHWWFLGNQLVPNVPCTANPTNNTALFVVWCAFNGAEQPQPTQIAAKCSKATNCDGTGNYCQGIDQARPILAAGAGAGAPTTLETAPRQYKVEAGSASGPLATLVSTSWLLSLQEGCCGAAAVWASDGDGLSRPQVELGPDDLFATEWRLTLRLNGHRICYTCSAGDWSPLGVNRLLLAEAPDGKGLPSVLTVFPV